MFTWNCRGRLVQVNRPMVMGVINITPDSFYAGSRVSRDEILQKAGQMLSEGADILDIGGQSSRPGSTGISSTEEIQRVIEPVRIIHEAFPEALLSIDTFYADVALKAVEAGASVVNDISAGKIDEKMTPAVASLRVPYVLMHMKGTPETMQQDPRYENVTLEVVDFFITELDRLHRAGIQDVIIDPGFGFGKSIEHNFELLRNLSALKILGKPVLAGLSRKSTIYKTLNITPGESVNGTTALNMAALMNGCHILRVHDVKEAKEVVNLFAKLNGSEM